MGGTALFEKSGIVSTRLDTAEFNRVQGEITTILDRLEIEYMLIPYIREKVSHGDIDIIVIDDRDDIRRKYDNITPLVKIGENLDKFGITDDVFINNNPTASMLYENKYQIDFILANRDSALYHKNYLSYNDLGNLLGRLVKQFNLTHGIDGLYYDHYGKDKSSRHRFLLTRKPDKIFDVLKIDKNKFYQGFDTYKEMFDFVMSSPMFKGDIFKFENLNHRNRTRDKKRSVYNEFLKYIDFDRVPTEYYNPLDDYPHIEHHVKHIVNEYNTVRLIRESVPGQLVMDITGLQGKQLGYIINKIKDAYGDKLIGMNEEMLIELIRLQHSAHKHFIGMVK